MNEKHKPVQQLSIEIKPEQAEGIYSNLVFIGHSGSEFMLDFARILRGLPGPPKAKVMSRIIMSPQHAELLRRTLEENIKKYEAKYGKIEIKDQQGHPSQMGFTPPEQN
jgi:hypothetical protein